MHFVSTPHAKKRCYLLIPVINLFGSGDKFRPTDVYSEKEVVWWLMCLNFGAYFVMTAALNLIADVIQISNF